ncbi:MAG TPA: flagellar basal body rod protein FlgB [Patescibacteria group bacterium]|nr:flagellar basal body rod protein FlgB [Patescibacteria group bacterium]
MNSVVSPSPLSVLESALGAAALRHRVISDNIANVNTPGFKKSEVNFEQQLDEALNGAGNKMALARTHEKHLPLMERQMGPSIKQITNTSMRVDGNNVDIDAEMAGMAKNTIYYDALTQQIRKYFSGLRSVITGGR